MNPLLQLRKAVKSDLKDAKKAQKKRDDRFLAGVVGTLSLVLKAIDVCIEKEAA